MAEEVNGSSGSSGNPGSSGNTSESEVVCTPTPEIKGPIGTPVHGPSRPPFSPPPPPENISAFGIEYRIDGGLPKDQHEALLALSKDFFSDDDGNLSESGAVLVECAREFFAESDEECPCCLEKERKLEKEQPKERKLEKETKSKLKVKTAPKAEPKTKKNTGTQTRVLKKKTPSKGQSVKLEVLNLIILMLLVASNVTLEILHMTRACNYPLVAIVLCLINCWAVYHIETPHMPAAKPILFVTCVAATCILMAVAYSDAKIVRAIYEIPCISKLISNFSPPETPHNKPM